MRWPLTLLAVAAAAFVAWRVARQRVAQRLTEALPPGVSLDPALRAYAPDNHDAAAEAMRAFAAEYRATFQHGGCTKSAVDAMHKLRWEALQQLYQLRMCLPNDLEAAVTQHIADVDHRLMAHVMDAQSRCGAALSFPGPIEDVFYRATYRAHNDVTV